MFSRSWSDVGPFSSCAMAISLKNSFISVSKVSVRTVAPQVCLRIMTKQIKLLKVGSSILTSPCLLPHLLRPCSDSMPIQEFTALLARCLDAGTLPQEKRRLRRVECSNTTSHGTIGVCVRKPRWTWRRRHSAWMPFEARQSGSHAFAVHYARRGTLCDGTRRPGRHCRYGELTAWGSDTLQGRRPNSARYSGDAADTP